MQNNLFSIGFRPFFLGASWLAVLWMALWISFLLWDTPSYNAIPPILWHGHEMLFGFAIAVIAGFLLTAMQNWTGLKLVTPVQLASLALLWLAARLAFAFSDSIPLWLISILDLSFLPYLCLIVSRTLIRAENKRNYSFIALLSAFWALNVMMHLELNRLVSGIAYMTLDIAVLLATTLLVFMGGRIIPFFTASRLPATAPRQWSWLNWASTLSTLLLIPAYAVVGRGTALIPLLLLAAILTAVRLMAWKPWRVFGEPMLWILHLGYAWIPVGLIILAANLLGAEFPWSAGVHALMVGAMSSLILGMMARVALGHTGRPIAASNNVIIAFLLITISAVTRVAAGLATEPQWALSAAALLWCLAFLIYAIEYTPILLHRRVDAA